MVLVNNSSDMEGIYKTKTEMGAIIWSPLYSLAELTIAKTTTYAFIFIILIYRKSSYDRLVYLAETSSVTVFIFCLLGSSIK